MSRDVYVEGRDLASALRATGSALTTTVAGLCDEIDRLGSLCDHHSERADAAEQERARVCSSRLAAIAESVLPAIIARQRFRTVAEDGAVSGLLDADQMAEVREQAYALAAVMLVGAS